MVRPWRFNELLRDLPGLSHKVLTENLRQMEHDGLIVLTSYPEVPPHVECSLSELGLTLRPVIDALREWGTMYQNIVRNS